MCIRDRDIDRDIEVAVFGSDDQSNWSTLDSQQLLRGEALLVKEQNLLFIPSKFYEIRFTKPVSQKYLKLEFNKKLRKVFKFYLIKDA